MDTESSSSIPVSGELTSHLGWFIGLGFALIILGILAVLVPLVATFAVTLLIGILFLVGGIMMIVRAIWHREHTFVTDIIIGVIYGIAGLLLLAHPLRGALTLALLLTAFFFVAGIFKIIHAIRMRRASGWGWLLFSGILSLLLGVLLFLGMPLTAFWAPGLIVGIDLMFTGWSLLMVSWAVRSHMTKGETFCIWGRCYAT